MRTKTWLAFVVAAAASLTGCGGGSVFGTTPGGGGGGSTGTSAADSLTLIADSASIASNATDPSAGVAGVSITAIVVDENNNAVSDAAVVFSAAIPTGSARSGAPAALLIGGTTTTSASGTATATVYTGGNGTLGVFEVTATVGTLSQTIQITVISPTTTGGGGVITAQNVTLVPSNNQLASDAINPADGVELRAIITDANSVAVPGVQVIFATTSGQLIVDNGGVTDGSGQVTATLTTGGDPSLRTITVTATAPRTGGGTVSRSTNIDVVTGASGAAVASMSLVASSSTLAADASSSADGVTLTVTALDSTRNTIANVNVAFTADKGAIQVLNGTTNSAGQATAVLTTGGDPALGTINVTAEIGSLTRTIQIEQVAAANPNVQIGTLNGSTFSIGDIAVGAPSISAGGSSALRVDIVDTNSSNAPYVGTSVTLTFNSTCVGAGLAQILGSPVTTSSGVANVTYVDKGCGGTDPLGNDDTIFVTTTVNGEDLSAQGTIHISPTSIGSLQFVSATPSIIGLKGSGQPETSVVVFKLVNSSGGPIADQTVNFSLNTTVGGITLGTAGLTTDSARTDASGLVQTQVNAGTVHTSVRVTATTTQGGNTFTTQSGRLVISAGNADQNSFSLSAECFNVEALSINGVAVPLTIHAADHFNNPVPDGTAIAFTTEGGAVQDSCETANGTCTVNWISQDPRPVSYGTADNSERAGRSTVMASALGEESFIDSDGDGLFDDGEFSMSSDLPEAFVDNNENGIWDVTLEEFLDFDEDGTYDNADGFYNGTLCAPGSTLCNDGSNSIAKSLHVRNELIIIMSGSSPMLTNADISSAGFTPGLSDPSGTFSVSVEGIQFLSFVVRDVNDQPMPSGTTVAVETSGNGGTISGTGSFTVPCKTDDSAAGNVYTFAIQGANAPGSGTLTLRVTSPGGLQTIYTFGLQTS